jgi:hypothetical protein
MKKLMCALLLVVATSAQAEVKARADLGQVTLSGVTSRTTFAEAADAVLRGIRASYYRDGFEKISTSEAEFVDIKELDQLAEREDLNGNAKLDAAQKQDLKSFADQNAGQLFVAQIGYSQYSGDGVAALFVVIARDKKSAYYETVDVDAE